MTSFEITLQLFDDTCQLIPGACVRALDFLEHATCTCSAIVQQQLGSGVWNERFAMKVLCRNPTSLESALRALRQHCSLINSSTTLGERDIKTQHLQILLAMKSSCECVNWHDMSNSYSASSDTTGGWGLLDTSLSHHTLSFNKLNFDRILRACPTALRLSALPSRTALQTKLNQDLLRAIKTKLKPKEDEDKSGYVYIMRRHSIPDYVKIGFTKKHVAIRHDALQGCFEDIRLVSHTSKVPNARKLEKLVHTELTYYRRWQDCGKCGTEHQEWFEISADAAKDVIIRWATWLTCEPYEHRTGKLTSYWEKTIAGDHTQNIVLTMKDTLRSMGLYGSINDSIRVSNVRMIHSEDDDASCLSSPHESDVMMDD